GLVGAGWSVPVSSMVFLHGGRQICAPFSEGDGQAAVDDPDALNFRVNEIWQESVQRENESSRFLVADEFRWQAVFHQPEEESRNGNHAERRHRSQRHAHLAAAGCNLANLHLEGDADELAYRAGDAHDAVLESQFQAL